MNNPPLHYPQRQEAGVQIPQILMAAISSLLLPLAAIGQNGDARYPEAIQV